MMREKLEKEIYENMTSLGEKEKEIEVKTMSQEEERKQIELFRKRLQKENGKKTEKRSYRKFAAAIVLMILLPTSVYAATHYENVKEIWLQYFTSSTSKLELAKIHDENWGKEGSQKEIVYEAFGVKLTIYSCFFEQEDSTFYVSYKMEDTNKISRVLGGDFGDGLVALAEKKEAVCIDVVGVDESSKKEESSEFSCGSMSWYNAENGLTYMKLDLRRAITERKLTPQIAFTKRMNDNWTDSLEEWEIVGKEYFDMPKAEHLETRIIQAKEDKNVKLKVTQQSLLLYVDSTQNRGVNILELRNEKAKIYAKDKIFGIDGISVLDTENSVSQSSTKDRVFEIDSSSGYYEDGDEGFYSVENEYTLGGADLSKIEKIEIGKYTFELSS